MSVTCFSYQARRQMKEGCSNCLFRCHEKLGPVERQMIYDDYWKLADKARQRNFILSRVMRARCKSRMNCSRRKFTLEYTFMIRNIQHRVCKIFFLETLGISAKTVSNALDKQDRSRHIRRPIFLTNNLETDNSDKWTER